MFKIGMENAYGNSQIRAFTPESKRGSDPHVGSLAASIKNLFSQYLRKREMQKKYNNNTLIPWEPISTSHTHPASPPYSFQDYTEISHRFQLPTIFLNIEIHMLMSIEIIRVNREGKKKHFLINT
jgi:glutaredoxin